MDKSQQEAIVSKDECVFCQIINDEKESYKIYEDENFVVILDYRPLNHGHCLILPKTHYETMLDAPNYIVGDGMVLAKYLVKVFHKTIEADGTFVAVNNKVSQSVPHLHIHVVPRFKKDGLFSKHDGLAWIRKPYKDDSQMKETAEELKSYIESKS
jgi:histidine triad (HIT) family protein